MKSSYRGWVKLLVVSALLAVAPCCFANTYYVNCSSATNGVWNARSFLYQLGTIKLVLRGAFDGTRQEAYGRADCEPAAAG